ncbi:membrane protein-like protein [Nitrobacter hamburgensis X14]|uniref:Membrane protein-like protein n=1 Tax=Nitrobacter hamburgensis (strain DSM 10229 / NCIMB 13809 / X14) TaxID=323097 RepID=Q1QGK9_NITHX|nr:DUF1003 domain-containing protein [Nitrobacter hamburgensis]ABE64638.1 membrane protein-like protein [Nitrobacter hamburgensis X14]
MTARGSQSTRAPSQARNNIEAILRFEKEDEKELALHHRIFHAIGWFFGTTHFLSAQCLAVCLWIALNSLVSSHQAIDPYPFPLLATFLSLEVVLLTSCVLMRQNAIDRTSERRDHLELQINLLAEQGNRLIDQSPPRRACSAHRDRPTKLATPLTASQQAVIAPRQQTASAEIPIASDAPPRPTSRGFLH